jgi:hypothetical protein
MTHRMRHLGLAALGAIGFLAACGGAGTAAQPLPPTASQAEAEPAPPAIATAVEAGETDSLSLPADVESYYKTIVWIEGTGQVMSKIDLNQWAAGSAEFMALLSIPGEMDNRVIWTQKEPLPESLAGAWAKALEAEQALMASLEGMMMVQLSQEAFLQAVADATALASEAVAEAEAVLAEEGAGPDETEALKRAALTEMGQAYKAAASMIVIVETERADDSD